MNTVKAIKRIIYAVSAGEGKCIENGPMAALAAIAWRCNHNTASVILSDDEAYEYVRPTGPISRRH